MMTQMTRAAANFLLGCGLALALVCLALMPGRAQAVSPGSAGATCYKICSQQDAPFVGQCINMCYSCADGECAGCYTYKNSDPAQYTRCINEQKYRCAFTGRKDKRSRPIVFPYGTIDHTADCSGIYGKTYRACEGSVDPKDPKGDICSNDTNNIPCADDAAAPSGAVEKQTCHQVQSSYQVKRSDGTTTLDLTSCLCARESVTNVIVILD